MLPLLLLTPHNWFIASGPSQVWAGGSWGYFRTVRDLANCEVISGGRRLETLTCFYMPDSRTAGQHSAKLGVHQARHLTQMSNLDQKMVQLNSGVSHVLERDQEFRLIL